MPQIRSENARIKRRVFSAVPPGHISLQLLSNSGRVPLKNAEFQIIIAPDRLESGTADDEGLIQIDNVPIGEYRMRLEGFSEQVVVPSSATDVERQPFRVPGYVLFRDPDAEGDDDGDTQEDTDTQEEIELTVVDNEDWEDQR